MSSTAPVDLADPEAAAAWVDAAAARAGGIDVLYNNASAPRVGRSRSMTWDDWRFTLHNELDLIFTVTKAAWPHLIARGGGVIINTASVSAHRGATFIEQAGHGAAKGGVLALTRHLAASGAPHGIRANSISPGPDRHSADRAVSRRARPSGTRNAPQPSARPAGRAGRRGRSLRCSSPPTTPRT